MYRIVRKEALRPTVTLYEIEAPLIAKKAQDAGITAVVFDRGGNMYHGRVAAVADGAREGGLAL